MNFLQKIIATFSKKSTPATNKEEIKTSEKQTKSSITNNYYDVDDKKHVVTDNFSMPKQEDIEPKLEPLFEKEYEWCIIGNIVDKHYWGEEKIIRRGTKQFRPNAKVYCFPEYAGTAHDAMLVMGQPRKQKRLITITINSKYIKNYRLKKVYQPKIREVIRNYHFYQTYSDEEMQGEEMQRFLEYLNSLTKEIKE